MIDMHKHANHHRRQAHRNHNAGRRNTAHCRCFAILGTKQSLHIGLGGNDAHNHGAQAKQAILHTATKKGEPGLSRQSSRQTSATAQFPVSKHTTHKDAGEN